MCIVLRHARRFEFVPQWESAWPTNHEMAIFGSHWRNVSPEPSARIIQTTESPMLDVFRFARRTTNQCTRGSPVGKKATPSIASPDASTSLICSGFAPPRAEASRNIRSAAIGVVSAGIRKIHGTLADVRDLSLLKAITGTKHFSANCSERWPASRSRATIASACSSIKA